MNNTSVDVGATVGATVELMENGSYRIAANNPQQLQQVEYCGELWKDVGGLILIKYRIVSLQH